MGRFFGPTSNVISPAGFFRGSAAPATGGSFMIVGADQGNPPTATSAFAAWRNPAGTWSVIDTTAVTNLAQGLFGVTHVAAHWYATSNAHGGSHGQVAVAADGNPPAAFTVTDSGFANDPLMDITYNTQFLIATNNADVVVAPLNLASFSRNGSNIPGSSTAQGIRGNTAGTSFVCVGSPGNGPNGISHSPDGLTWTNLSVSFECGDASSNTLIWDGSQFVAVGPFNVVVSSADGLTWAIGSINTGTANVIAWDAQNHLYLVGDSSGNAFSSSTVAGLATASPVATGSAGSLRCAASIGGVTLFGDSHGNVFVTHDGGVTYVAENPGLGTCVLTSASSSS